MPTFSVPCQVSSSVAGQRKGWPENRSIGLRVGSGLCGFRMGPAQDPVWDLGIVIQYVLLRKYMVVWCWVGYATEIDRNPC